MTTAKHQTDTTTIYRICAFLIIIYQYDTYLFGKKTLNCFGALISIRIASIHPKLEPANIGDIILGAPESNENSPVTKACDARGAKP